MDWLPTWINTSNFSLFADILSVVGVITTISVYLSVRKIKKFYVFRARIPELLNKLSTHSGEISKLNKNYLQSLPKISLEIGRLEITLKSIKKKVSKEIKPSVSESYLAIKAYRSTPNSDLLWQVYISLQRLQQEIELHQEDQKWEMTNV